jgi:uncharacterized protein
MKQLFIMIILSSTICSAQNADYKVVFDMTSKDTVNQQAVIRQVQGIKKASPDALLEVVVYGEGLSLVLKDKSNQASNVEKLIADGNAKFKICRMTMIRNGIETNQLIAGVMVVDDGIYEIVKRQKDGWGYIKVGH